MFFREKKIFNAFVQLKGLKSIGLEEGFWPYPENKFAYLVFYKWLT